MAGSVENIWESAASWQKRQNHDHNLNYRQRESTLLLVGNKGVGKSTLIHSVLERQEPPKPTLALEYTYGRRTNQNLTKNICHIWELGGGSSLSNLLETPISALKLPSLHVAIMVDLSEPHQLWFILDSLLSAIQGHINKTLKTSKAEEIALREALEGWKQSRIDNNHPDIPQLKVFPTPLSIIGGNYDKFAEMEPEHKKIICKSLRFVAHYYGANLQFYSAKDGGLVKRTRGMFTFRVLLNR